jgi:hypothetical protein
MYVWMFVLVFQQGSQTSQHFLLRDELYFDPSTYYVAIVLDIVMRLGWAILISPGQSYVEQHVILMLGE